MAEGYIDRVAAAALERFDEVIDWLGLSNGKRQGVEWVVLNPRRPDNSPGSFSINSATGGWGDFAVGAKGNDLVSLTAYLKDVRQIEAANQLGALLGIAASARQNRAARGAAGAGNASAPATTKPPASGPNSQAAQSAGECVLPVPDDAPARPKKHPKLGAPVMAWEYRDAAGALLFLVCRFELADGGKEIRPLTLRRMPSGELVWRWLGMEPPRALYGLDRLAARPDAPVLICEGEKAADAAAVLLPDHVAITSPNGAKAADKADWAPLAGRCCAIWPDADAAGDGYAEEVCRRLQSAKVAVVQRLDTAMFRKLPDGTMRDALPAGWDAADALVEGFAPAIVAERIAALGDRAFVDAAIAGAAKAATSRAKDDGPPARPHFSLDDRGVWFVGTDKEGNSTAPRWICAPLDVLAMVRDPLNRGWGKLVAFEDPDGNRHREIIPDALLCGDGAEMERMLRGWGLQIAPKGRAPLLEYLITSRPKDRARITPRTGWHEGDAGSVFVLPDDSIGVAGELWLFEEAGALNTFKTKGSLAEWRMEVGARCAGNSRLVFAVSMALASPLLHLAGMESGGFHFRSNSSDGKTTALRVAASVCGGPDYMQRWRATDNGLEALAMQHCDAPLLLDELAQLDPRAAGEVAYMLANGAGKARAQRSGGMRDTAYWRLLFLSAGEIGLAQHMMEAGKQAKAGQELRVAEIPADAGAGLGIFEHLHGEANGAELSRALDCATRKHYGVAWRAFLAELVKRQDTIVETLREARKAFERHYLSVDASGQARRVADRFALVGAAGELASRWEITGWAAGAAMKAAGACFSAWLTNRGGEGNAEDRAMLAQVREFLRRYGESAFTDWERPANDSVKHSPVRDDRAGYRKHDPVTDEIDYYIFTETFRTRICKGYHAAAMGRLLLARGYVEEGKEAGREWTVKEKLPTEGRARVVHVLPAIWADDDD